MKKIAYILGYIGAFCTIVLSMLNILVSYSYYLNQPTVLSNRSVISSIILVFLSILILILIHKLDFKKASSNFLLIFMVILSLSLPGILEYEAKLRYFPQYAPKNFSIIIWGILHKSLEYFPLVLVLLSAILFLIPNKIKRDF